MIESNLEIGDEFTNVPTGAKAKIVMFIRGRKLIRLRSDQIGTFTVLADQFPGRLWAMTYRSESGKQRKE